MGDSFHFFLHTFTIGYTIYPWYIHIISLSYPGKRWPGEAHESSTFFGPGTHPICRVRPASARRHPRRGKEVGQIAGHRWAGHVLVGRQHGALEVARLTSTGIETLQRALGKALKPRETMGKSHVFLLEYLEYLDYPDYTFPFWRLIVLARWSRMVIPSPECLNSL